MTADESPPSDVARQRVLSRSLPAICCAGLLVLALLLAACGAPATSSSTSHASPTANVNATQKAYAEQHGPVTVAVSLLKQEGSLASHDLNLVVQVIVTNHAVQPTWLYGTCPQPATQTSLTPLGASTSQVRILYSALSCPVDGAPDQHRGPGIPPNGSETLLRYTSNLFDYYPDWPAGPYTLTVTITAWYQFTPQDQVSAHGSALGQTVITLK